MMGSFFDRALRLKAEQLKQLCDENSQSS